MQDTSPKTALEGKAELQIQHRYGRPFYECLTQLGVSLVISTYKAGHVVSVWAEEEGKCGTAYTRMPKPMGMSWQPGSFSIATRSELLGFRQLNNISVRGEGTYDAIFLPQVSSYTGDILAHDVAAFTDTKLVVNTAFSCVVQIGSNGRSDVVWQPSFISELLPQDRCHLNGLATREGKLAYVTALGETNEPRGWRANKASGGCIIDTTSNEVLVRGLSMPHSPRLHREKLYFINSGEGQLCELDLTSRQVRTIVELPGFGRGMSLVGQYAFVALSKARESAFGQLPITSTGKELTCGVVVVDIESGQLIALLDFSAGVTELFEVVALPYKRARIVGPHMKDDGFGEAWLLGEQFVYKGPKAPAEARS